MDRLNDGHALSLLACAFTRTAREDGEAAGDKPFAEDWLQPLFLPEAAVGGEISNRAFVEVLLEQCERHIFSFKGSDVLHLCLALANLVRTGNEDAIAPRLIPRLAKRLEALYYELVPGQFVRFLELFPFLPEVE
ncbi:PLSCR2, partial [Symbiodinium necroappetens]